MNEQNLHEDRKGGSIELLDVTKMNENGDNEIFSSTVEIAANKLRFLASNLANHDDSLGEMREEDVQALGFILFDIGNGLKEWNRKN